MAWAKINAFCIDIKERFAFTGNIAGMIQTVHIDSMAVLSEAHGHSGTIAAMAAHPTLPLIAALGMEQSVTIWRYDESGKLHLLHDLSARDIRCDNDEKERQPSLSESQAIGFHSTKRQLAARAGSGGLLEISFDDDSWKLLRCTRVHPHFGLTTVRYLPGSDIVAAGMTRGGALLCENGKVIREWRFGDENVHWFEQYDGETYLVASDTRRVIRLDLSGRQEPLEGEIFAADGVEHVNYNRKSGRVFAASFDRNVYEIDPVTCANKGVVYAAPFKNRWVKTLERDPDVMLLQCRNGAFYKADLSGKRETLEIKGTPDALWSAVKTAQDTLVIAGEGPHYWELSPRLSRTRHARKTAFDARKEPLNARSETYTKRVAVHPSLGITGFARTDGEIIIRGSQGQYKSVMMDSAVRDLVFHHQEPWLYAACEAGDVLRIDAEGGSVLEAHRRTKPVWAIDHNPQRELLAISERMGELAFLDGITLEQKGSEAANESAKRVKWIDADRLLYNFRGALLRYDMREKKSVELFRPQSNTIEDFAWDSSRRFLAFIAYTRNVTLCDYETGRILSVVPDQMDYSKGLLWLDRAEGRSAYPYEFVTFGRSGVPHLYQVHDGKILALGQAAEMC